ncbi:MAG: hypothetical protein HY426_01100 [Candidatus Levybacteria bacterium]|nr:hypothetical protein [Candidatus Levybacteria bacterium]
MSKDQQKFQKAFLLQMRATLRGNASEASKTRQLVNFYRKKLEDRN